MPTNEEKRAKYADLGRRLAAAKARAARKRGELLPEEEEPKKGNGQSAPAKAASKKEKPAPKRKVKKGPADKLSKEEKKPKLTKPPASTVDENLRAMLEERDNIDENTNLSMFQVALVEKIREHGELGVLDLSYMIWDRAEINQARVNPIGGKPVDLTRIVRNAIRTPKSAGIIAPSGNRGKYVFVEWKKAGRRK